MFPSTGGILFEVEVDAIQDTEGPNGSDKSLVGRWRMYLKWEEGNPLEIDEKDYNLLHLRVQSIYRKALVRMRFFPEIWCVYFPY